ncbi:hypothetical protein PMAYCL1PPCAC_09238, partial [Pristionchus mayeri]
KGPLDDQVQNIIRQVGEMHRSCDMLAANSSFIRLLVDSKFDVAFTYQYHYCPIGAIHAAGIPTWIWLDVGALMDSIAEFAGVPQPPSYCTPITMDAGNELTFAERINSFLGQRDTQKQYKALIGLETAAWRKYHGDNPDLQKLASDAPLIIVNSHELYELPSPSLHNIINIGSVGISSKNAKNLTGEFAARVDASNLGHIVISYGSLTPMYLMPETWRNAFIRACTAFPDVQFLIRHEHPEDIQPLLPPNAFAAVAAAERLTVASESSRNRRSWWIQHTPDNLFIGNIINKTKK